MARLASPSTRNQSQNFSASPDQSDSSNQNTILSSSTSNASASFSSPPMPSTPFLPFSEPPTPTFSTTPEAGDFAAPSSSPLEEFPSIKRRRTNQGASIPALPPRDVGPEATLESTPDDILIMDAVQVSVVEEVEEIPVVPTQTEIVTHPRQSWCIIQADLKALVEQPDIDAQDQNFDSEVERFLIPPALADMKRCLDPKFPGHRRCHGHLGLGYGRPRELALWKIQRRFAERQMHSIPGLVEWAKVAKAQNKHEFINGGSCLRNEVSVEEQDEDEGGKSDDRDFWETDTEGSSSNAETEHEQLHDEGEYAFTDEEIGTSVKVSQHSRGNRQLARALIFRYLLGASLALLAIYHVLNWLERYLFGVEFVEYMR
ncbi:hypothetical protein BS50DRAFT_651019 [Corynespora cassiicola Philippines]|uniref:Uncharacterized protein n=1 Tax=Corynespora cassiicola Philippines TaxID=1448308 RepID=A0A2T2N9C2_CORCC|nr:hypothetical protein BS50DRAFT_651019 [Corynespora cassiicola Philippines]